MENYNKIIIGLFITLNLFSQPKWYGEGYFISADKTDTIYVNSEKNTFSGLDSIEVGGVWYSVLGGTTQPVDSLYLAKVLDSLPLDGKIFHDEKTKLIAYFVRGQQNPNYINVSAIVPIVNETNDTLFSGTPISVKDTLAFVGTLPLVSGIGSMSNNRKLSELTIGAVDGDIPPNSIGIVSRFDFITGDRINQILDTFNIGDRLWVKSDTSALVNKQPMSPNYPVLMGTVFGVPGNKVFGVNAQPFNGNDTEVNWQGGLNGVIIQKAAIKDTVEPGSLFFETYNENHPTNDLPYIYNGSRYLLNTTDNIGRNGWARVSLLFGQDTSALTNFIYIDTESFSEPKLVSNTIGFPDNGVPLGICGVYSQAIHLSRGFAYFQRINNEPNGSLASGYVRRNGEVIRLRGSQYGKEGIDPTFNIIIDGASKDSLRLSTTSGVNYQFNKQTAIAKDGYEYLWLNSTTGERWITDLNQVDSTQGGISLHINNRRYVLDVFYIQNSGGIKSHLAVNAPINYYSSDNGAIYDANGYGITSVPQKFSSTAVYLFRIVLSYSSSGNGTFTNLLGAGVVKDNRGQVLGGSGSGSGGGSSAQTNFSTADFYTYDNTDPTKKQVFDNTGITTGNIRVIKTADKDIDMDSLVGYNNVVQIAQDSLIERINTDTIAPVNYLNINYSGLGNLNFISSLEAQLQYNGTTAFSFNADRLRSFNTSGWAILNSTPSTIVPSYSFNTDQNTGISGSENGKIHLISDGVPIINIYNDSTTIKNNLIADTIILGVQLGDTLFSGNTGGGGTGNVTRQSYQTLNPASINLGSFDETFFNIYNQTGSLTITDPITTGSNWSMNIPIRTNGDTIILPESWYNAGNDYYGNAKAGLFDLIVWEFHPDSVVYTLKEFGRPSIVTVPNPVINSGTMAVDNTYIDVNLNTGGWGDNTATSPMALADFTATYTQNGDAVTGITPTTLTNTSGGALAGNELTARLNFTTSGGASTGLGTVEVTPTDGASVYNIVGVAMAGTETTGAVNLTDEGLPQLSAPTLNPATMGTSTADLNWNQITNNDGYGVYYKLQTEPTIWTLFETTVPNDITSQITGLASGTPYDFSLITKGDGISYLDSDRSTTLKDTTETIVSYPVPTDYNFRLVANDTNVTIENDNKVTIWSDISGNGTDFAFDITGDSVPYTPIALNGEPGVTFTADARLQSSSDDILDNEDGFTTIIVSRELTGSNTAMVNNGSGGTASIFGRRGFVEFGSRITELPLDVANESDNDINYVIDNNYSINIVRWLPRIEGVSYDDGVKGTSSTTTASYVLNNNYGMTNINGQENGPGVWLSAMSGTILELSNFKRAISELEIAGLVDELSTKYNISTTLTGLSESTPIIDSADCGVIADTAITLYVNEILDQTSIPATTDFSVSGIASAPTISSLKVGNNYIRLYLSDTIAHTDNPTVSYTKPVSNEIKTPSGIEMATFASQATNNYLFDETDKLFILDANYANSLTGTSDSIGSWADKDGNGITGSRVGSTEKYYNLNTFTKGSKLISTYDASESFAFEIPDLTLSDPVNGLTIITAFIPYASYVGRYHRKALEFHIEDDEFLLYGDGGATSSVSYTALDIDKMVIMVCTWTPSEQRVWLNGVEQTPNLSPVTALDDQATTTIIGGSVVSLRGKVDIPYFGVYNSRITNGRISDIVSKLGYRFSVAVDTTGF